MPVASTHELTFGPTTVTKTYSSWGRGEPGREWEALQLVHSRRPDLVPEPLEAGLGETPPWLTMSRLPGDPVGQTPISSECLDAIAAALTEFHEAVPVEELTGIPTRYWDPPSAFDELRSWVAESTPTEDPLVCRALAQAKQWIDSVKADDLARAEQPVFGRADGNLGNLIWDGQQVRILDLEDAGVSDSAYELADLVEHISVTHDAGLDADDLIDRFDLSRGSRQRVREFRRLFGLFWLLMLLPGNPAHHRNPPGTLERQATRCLTLF